MGRLRLTKEEDESLCLRYFPKKNRILIHYMFSVWWLHVLYGLGHYVIHLSEFAHIFI